MLYFTDYLAEFFILLLPNIITLCLFRLFSNNNIWKFGRNALLSIGAIQFLLAVIIINVALGGPDAYGASMLVGSIIPLIFGSAVFIPLMIWFVIKEKQNESSN